MSDVDFLVESLNSCERSLLVPSAIFRRKTPGLSDKYVRKSIQEDAYKSDWEANGLDYIYVSRIASFNRMPPSNEEYLASECYAVFKEEKPYPAFERHFKCLKEAICCLREINATSLNCAITNCLNM
jgi:hypothetical protein